MLLHQYVLNTSFHGIRYMGESHRHWTERLFWLICCVLSWIASALLMKASWYDFQNNAISFVVETSYLDWNTHFPSIAVCETDNQERIAEFTDRLYGDPHDYNFDELVKELAFFRGLSYYTMQLCGPFAPPSPNCVQNNFGQFGNLVRSNCTQLFRKCVWNDVEFDCCRYFHPLSTELGVCFAINNNQTGTEYKERLPMISNKNTGPGTLYFELNGFSNVHLLSDVDVPSLTSLQTDVLQVAPNIFYHRVLAIKEIENQREVRDVSIHQRNCRYVDETDMNVYPFYSYSSCSVQCRKDAQLRICNCTHHFMPRTDARLQCDIYGLDCLNNHYNDLAVIKTNWANRSGLICECIPSCTELEMSIITDDKISENYAKVQLSLERLPAERYKRNVVRGKLDLVVSMGGTAALFLGASLLSVVELIYYFSLRLYGDWMRKDKGGSIAE